MGSYWSVEGNEQINVPQPWFDKIAEGSLKLWIVKDDVPTSQNMVLTCSAETVNKTVVNITSHSNITEAIETYGSKELRPGVSRSTRGLKRLYRENAVKVINFE